MPTSTGFRSCRRLRLTPGSFQTDSGGAAERSRRDWNATGTAPVYSTELGGDGKDEGLWHLM